MIKGWLTYKDWKDVHLWVTYVDSFDESIKDRVKEIACDNCGKPYSEEIANEPCVNSYNSEKNNET
jgi:hypothetical protein